MTMDLTAEIRTPTLSIHEFFKTFVDIYPRITRRFCHGALHPHSPAPEELIFGAMETAHRMYFVLSGELSYTIVHKTSMGLHSGAQPERVQQDHYLAEPALWIEWVHRGDLYVTSFATMLLLEVAEFQMEVKTYQPA